MRNCKFARKRLLTLVVITIGLAVAECGLVPRQSFATDMRTYYVSNSGNDTNDGLSAGHAWKSLNKVNNATYKPGDRILFDAEGVWNGQLILDGEINGQGSAEAPITISSYHQGNSGKKAIINGLGTTADDSPYHVRKLSNIDYMTGAVELWNANHWTISNLEVTNSTGSGSRNAMRIGILVASDINTAYPSGNDAAAVQEKLAIFKASHRTGINITKNYVHNVDGAYQGDPVQDSSGKTVSAGKNSGGIIIVGNTDVAAQDNVVSDVSNEGLRNDANASVLPGGWDQYSFQPSARTTFTNNYIRNSAGDGIVISSSENGTAEYNTVEAANSMPGSKNASGVSKNFAGLWFMGGEYNIAQYNEVFGIPNHYFDGTAFDFDGFASKGVYQYNYSHDNSGGFTLFMGDHQTDNVFRYNLSIHDVRDTPSPALNHLIFVVSGKSDGIDGFPLFTNNTFIVGAAVKNLMMSNNGQTGIRFVNNLIYAPLGNDPRFVVDQSGLKNPLFTEGRLDHNLFFPQAMFDRSHAGTVDDRGNVFENPQLKDALAEPSGIIDHADKSFNTAGLSSFVPEKGSPAANAGTDVDKITPDSVKDKFPISHDLAGRPINWKHPTIGAFEAKEPVAPDVVLDRSEAELTEGESIKLRATSDPAGLDVAWSSSDESVAAVSPDGTVRALRAGNATITAEVTDGGLTGSASCSVLVTAKDEPVNPPEVPPDSDGGHAPRLHGGALPDAGDAAEWAISLTALAGVASAAMAALVRARR